MRRCLVIDDAPLIRKIARMILEQMRYEVQDAATAEEGLERCKERLPDIILLDWHLPGTTAMQFLSGLRPLVAADSGSKPFVLYVTTDNDPVALSRAFNAGCDDFMMKPFTRADLEAKFGFLPAIAVA